MSTVGSVMRERTCRLVSPTTTPTPRATRTARANPPRTPPTLTLPEVAAVTAEERTTRAVASLRSPSPSRTVMMRCETPRRRAMEMATASVGLRMAPMATAQAKDRPGTRRVRANPMAPADSATRRTARMATEAISRRKLMVEMLTAVENSSGGRMPSRTTPGSNSTAGTKGRKPTPIPAASRMRAGATPMRLLNCDAAAIPSTPSTAIMRRSMEASLRSRECASPGANSSWTDTAPFAEIGRIPPRDRFTSGSRSVLK